MRQRLKYWIRRVLFLFCLPLLVIGSLITNGGALLELINPTPPVLHNARTGEEIRGIQTLYRETTMISVAMSWADWCPVCHEMLPELQKVYEMLREKGYIEVEIVAVNSGDSDAKIRSVADKYGLRFHMVGGAQPSQGYPTIYILGQVGDNDWQVFDEKKGAVRASVLFNELEGLVLELRQWREDQGIQEITP